MAKTKLTLSLDAREIDKARRDAEAAGVTLSDYVAGAIRNERYRRLLAQATPTPPSDEGRLRKLLEWQSDPAA